MRIKSSLATLLLAMVAALFAPPTARADVDEFLDYLDRNGVNTSTSELAQSGLEVGKAVCGLYDAHVDQGDSKSVTNGDALDRMTGGATGNTTEQAAMWVVGAVNYLCPRYKWMM
jgi:hypothetical protein